MNYMRETLEDKYGFLELQDKILEIAVDFDKFCSEHDIEYCLMGGSALGAKRHGGFIPWDDDLDVFMTPSQYEKFRECFKESGNKEKYYLQEWGARDGMVSISKIRMNNTEYIEEILEGWDIHQGIYIDIFILHTCPNNRLLQMHQCLWAKYVVMKGLADRGYNKRGGFLGFALKLMAILPDGFLVKHGLKQVYRYRNKKTDWYCNFLGRAVFKNAKYKREWFENLEYTDFETVKLKAPGGLHDFLSFRFGDYMKIPSADRIKWEQHAKSWNFERGSSNDKKYKDERKLV